MTSPAVTQIEALYKRLEKAKELVANGKVHPIMGIDSHYAVESCKKDGFYLVNGECTCPDAQMRMDTHKGWCKHKLAVELFKDTPQEAGDHAGTDAPQTPNPTDKELERMARYYNHYVPGDAPVRQDDRSPAEQLRDLY